jgi:hypothetical protein
MPNPSPRSVRLALDLPADARVLFSVYDLLGREVWREPERLAGAGRVWLAWGGVTPAGDPAPAGVYYARVLVNGVPIRRRIALIP